MTISKYILVLAMATIPASTPTNSQSVSSDRAYILGFEDGSEAVTNAVNAEMCAKHYRQQGQGPGPECYKFFENFKLRVARYDKIKRDLKAAEEENGKNSSRDKKNSNKRKVKSP